MIETAEDYNARLAMCGCCEIPLCPTPVIKCERLIFYGYLKWYVYEDDTPIGIFYKTRLVEYTSSGAPNGEKRFTHTPPYELKAGNEIVLPSTIVETVVPPAAGFSTTTAVDPIDTSAALADTLAEVAANVVWDDSGKTYQTPTTQPTQNSLTDIYDPLGTGSGLFVKWYVRIRFKIPSSHLGTYFKMTFDVAEFPESGSPSFVSTDNVIEWTGPGNALDPNDASWLTDWFQIDPPAGNGQRRAVNLRFTCRHGANIPALPQVWGEALEV